MTKPVVQDPERDKKPQLFLLMPTYSGGSPPNLAWR